MKNKRSTFTQLALFALFASAILSSPSALSASKSCSEIFDLKRAITESRMVELVERKSDFVTPHFGSNWSYLANGCGAVCATNIVQSLRINAGLQALPYSEQFNRIATFFNPDYSPNSFGYHGSPGTMHPLNVGSLAKLVSHISEQSEIATPEIRAYQKIQHMPYLKNESGIEFVRGIDPNSAFRVDESSEKIILVEVSDNDKPPATSHLTAHFYTVAGFSGDTITLHDPNQKSKLFQFRLVPYSSGEFQTFELKPFDPEYTIDSRFPRNLHYMVNGYVSVKSN